MKSREQTHAETWIDFSLFPPKFAPGTLRLGRLALAFIPPPTLISSHLFRLHFQLVWTHTHTLFPYGDTLAHDAAADFVYAVLPTWGACGFDFIPSQLSYVPFLNRYAHVDVSKRDYMFLTTSLRQKWDSLQN